MNLNHLEAFCLVVKTGSITKAAKKLHISQPALSLQIQDLENDFEGTLLERSNRGVKPTELGEIVYNYGNKILNIAKNMEKEAESLRSNSTEQLTVAASSTIGNFALPCSIYIFKEKFPQHDISLDISDTNNVVDKLLEGSINIGVIEGPPVGPLKETIQSEKLKVKKIAEDELVLVTPYSEEWKDRSEIEVDELLSLKLILREKGSGIRETIEETLLEHHLPEESLNIIFDLNSINAIISAVAADRGISILPKMALRKELRHRTLKAIKVKGITFKHNIYMLYYPTINKPGLPANFIEFLSSEDRGFC